MSSRRHYAHLRAALHHEETLLWAAHADAAAVGESLVHIEAAEHFMRRLAATLAGPGSGQSAGVWCGVAQGIVERADNAMGLRHSEVLHPLFAALRRTQDGPAEVPAWVDPAVVASLLDDRQGPTRAWLVRDAATGCLLLQAQPPGAGQSPLGEPLMLDAGGARVSVGEGAGVMTRWLSAGALPLPLARLDEPIPVQIHTAREAITLAAIPRPRGALGWGCDRTGIAVQSPALGPFPMRWSGDALRAAPMRGAASPMWALEGEVPVPLSSTLSEAAVRFGIDTLFGVYADFTVTTPNGSTTQRVRFIEPAVSSWARRRMSQNALPAKVRATP